MNARGSIIKFAAYSTTKCTICLCLVIDIGEAPLHGENYTVNKASSEQPIPPPSNLYSRPLMC